MARTTRKTPDQKQAAAKSAKPAESAETGRPLFRRLLRWVGRGLAGVAAFFLALVLIYAVVPPPTTPYMLAESIRLGGVERDWVSGNEIAPVMMRSAVAAEDANFCLHWGFDMAAIREAVSEGGTRGASTISQQVAKNVFLWQGRNWVRKALEAALTPVVELVWTKRRILVVYLNVAEFGEGVFGVEKAAQHYFGVGAADLTPLQAARLAAILPDPKDRNAAEPSRAVRSRAAGIVDGAETIRQDGRAGCFEPAPQE